MKKFTLINGAEIPALGFGTWQIEGDLATKAVEIALEVGYRHLDCADAYHNQEFIKPAIAGSGLKREELFITSKIWRDSYHRNKAKEAGKRIIDTLGVDYLDMLLIHWPDKNIPIMETLQDLFDLKSDGLIKEWGVSNCTIHHLEDIISRGVEIANNQVEFHPSLNQKELKEFCDQHQIQLTAYSPIAQGQDLKLPLIQELAKDHEASESQVILNWIIQKGIVAIPKGTTRDHIEDNFKSINWELNPDEIEQIDKLNRGNRLITPEFNEFDY